MSLSKIAWVLISLAGTFSGLQAQAVTTSKFPLIISDSVLSVDFCRGTPISSKAAPSECIKLNSVQKITADEAFHLGIAKARRDISNEYLNGYHIRIKYWDEDYSSPVNLMISCRDYKNLQLCFKQKIRIVSQISKLDMLVTRRVYGPVIVGFTFLTANERTMKQKLFDLLD